MDPNELDQLFRQTLDGLLATLADDCDHPEVWQDLAAGDPEVMDVLGRMLAALPGPRTAAQRVLRAVTQALAGDPQAARRVLADALLFDSQSPLVNGALFWLEGRLDPDNPRYRLAGRICPVPFERLDVLEASAHQCCASWLRVSAGNLFDSDWRDVWNSAAAQAVRASILDGSYRHCNKIACPTIQTDALIPAGQLRAQSAEWARRIDTGETALPEGPRTVNLAYDRTCNLSCPSCRSEPIAVGEAERVRIDAMQQRNVYPLLRKAELCLVTGSGDPFASKTFRRLLAWVSDDTCPRLKLNLMTNGLLLTPKEWARFPNLAGKVARITISIDGAHAATHEALRRGSDWATLRENLAFVGTLRARGDIDDYQLVFVVQQENFREMGDAVELARAVGADVYFARITNWGTFTPQDYARKAVFLGTHPEHPAFLAALRDPRLAADNVLIGDLEPLRALALAGSEAIAAG